MSGDDVLDYMLMEAVATKVAVEDKQAQEEAEKAAKKKEWKEDTSELNEFR